MKPDTSSQSGASWVAVMQLSITHTYHSVRTHLFSPWLCHLRCDLLSLPLPPPVEGTNLYFNHWITPTSQP